MPPILEKAGYQSNPLEDGTLTDFRLYTIDISELTAQALKDMGISKKEIGRCKNYYALGLMLCLYSRPLESEEGNIRAKFAKKPEIAEANVIALRAAYGGVLGLTTTSGPGMALKTEALGLAVMLELPLVITNVQRGGPSTGLPTKVEQSDLLQAVYGRNGECPIPVIAARSPADCFDCAIEAFRIAVKYMTPVIFLSDGGIGNAAEPWRIPDPARLSPLAVKFRTDPEGFQPYARDENLARAWVRPGTPGMEHRVGGLEKNFLTGNISHDPINHERMVDVRAAKVAGIAKDIPPLMVEGPGSGDLLIVGWGSTYGSIVQAREKAALAGKSVAHVHLRHLNPLPHDLGDIMSRYREHPNMTALFKGSCLAIYLLALVGIFIDLPAGVAAPVQYGAVILLGAHVLEIFVAFKSIRLYRGSLVVSIVLTVLFGFLHWMPLARAKRRTGSPKAARGSRLGA
ncbi:2-oxoacid:acceptor oxidoreductase family protein [Aromatoleum bremense]|nr:2-oxoacid:acceptor oxidoreductase family protein [Aromatoleum bremense]